MNNTPTEEGFYFARVDGRWQPVEYSIGPYGPDLQLLKDSMSSEFSGWSFKEIEEWGEKIERKTADLNLGTP